MNVAKTCRYYAVSRNTYYVLCRRYRAPGQEGLSHLILGGCRAVAVLDIVMSNR